LQFQASQGKKLARLHPNKLNVVVHNCGPSYIVDVGRRITGKKKRETLSKI
jgi:hypothetical protein